MCGQHRSTAALFWGKKRSTHWILCWVKPHVSNLGIWHRHIEACSCEGARKCLNKQSKDRRQRVVQFVAWSWNEPCLLRYETLHVTMFQTCTGFFSRFFVSSHDEYWGSYQLSSKIGEQLSVAQWRCCDRLLFWMCLITRSWGESVDLRNRINLELG
jgi:hypothetical protein